MNNKNPDPIYEKVVQLEKDVAALRGIYGDLAKRVSNLAVDLNNKVIADRTSAVERFATKDSMALYDSLLVKMQQDHEDFMRKVDFYLDMKKKGGKQKVLEAGAVGASAFAILLGLSTLIAGSEASLSVLFVIDMVAGFVAASLYYSET